MSVGGARSTVDGAITTPGRLTTYGVLAIAVVALFLAGLAIPFVLGDPVPEGQALQTGAPLGGGPAGGATAPEHDLPARDRRWRLAVEPTRQPGARRRCHDADDARRRARSRRRSGC